MIGNGGGRLSADNAPPAKPEWVARIQRTTAEGDPIDPQKLNLIALVDEAAREHDLNGLVRLSNGEITQAQLAQPKVLDELVALLEKTHGAVTDGLTYPSFTLGGDATATSIADRKALGVASAAGYKGLFTVFEDGQHPMTWVSLMSHSSN